MAFQGFKPVPYKPPKPLDFADYSKNFRPFQGLNYQQSPYGGASRDIVGQAQRYTQTGQLWNPEQRQAMVGGFTGFLDEALQKQKADINKDAFSRGLGYSSIPSRGIAEAQGQYGRNLSGFLGQLAGQEAQQGAGLQRAALGQDIQQQEVNQRLAALDMQSQQLAQQSGMDIANFKRIVDELNNAYTMGENAFNLKAQELLQSGQISIMQLSAAQRQAEAERGANLFANLFGGVFGLGGTIAGRLIPNNINIT